MGSLIDAILSALGLLTVHIFRVRVHFFACFAYFSLAYAIGLNDATCRRDTPKFITSAPFGHATAA